MKKLCAVLCFSVLLSGCSSIKYTAKKDIKVEYGTDINVNTLINDSKETIYIDEINGYNPIKLGKQTIQVVLKNEENEKVTKKFNIEVVDTTGPEIGFWLSNVEVNLGDTFDSINNIEYVTDNLDGELEYYDTKPEGSGYYFEGDTVDTSKEGKYTVNVIATDTSNNESTKSFTVSVSKKVNAAETTYNKMVNLTVDDLTKSKAVFGIDYQYKGLSLLEEDVNWIQDSLNKEGTVNQGAIYRKIAKCLDYYSLTRNYNGIKDFMFDNPPSKDEFEKNINEYKSFITEEDSLNAIMKKFETLSSVNGEFDYSGKVFSFTIDDLDSCAKELNISSEMLGYILGELDEYGAGIQFKENSLVFELK